MGNVTVRDIEQCSEILSNLDSGILPLKIFSQVARLVRLPMVILITYKKEGDKEFIGLLKREPDDLWWANKWALPGTVLTSLDTFESALDRLKQKEILVQNSSSPKYHGHIFHKSDRGDGVIFIYRTNNVELLDGSALEWFDVDNLPENLIPSEGEIISSWLRLRLNV